MSSDTDRCVLFYGDAVVRLRRAGWEVDYVTDGLWVYSAGCHVGGTLVRPIDACHSLYAESAINALCKRAARSAVV